MAIHSRSSTDTDTATSTDLVAPTDIGGQITGTPYGRTGRARPRGTSGQSGTRRRQGAFRRRPARRRGGRLCHRPGRRAEYRLRGGPLAGRLPAPIDDIPDYKLQENNRSKDDKPEDIPFSDNVSFYETLKEQLDMQALTPEEKQLGEYLIGSLDDDGLLRKSIDTLIDELAIYQGINATPQEAEHVLSIIPGTSTRRASARENLQECLLTANQAQGRFAL